MASSPTLQNFGVPNGADGRGGILMPKVKNRFRVILHQFAGLPSAVKFTQQVVTVARPNVTFAPQTVHSYNSTAYYAGKAEWETVSVTVRDDMSNHVAKLVGAQLQTQMNFFDQTVPAGAHSYKFNMVVDTLDGGDYGTSSNAALESWTFEGCFLSATNYESFDYSSSDAMTIEMTIRFDNVMQGEQLMPIDQGSMYSENLT